MFTQRRTSQNETLLPEVLSHRGKPAANAGSWLENFANLPAAAQRGALQEGGMRYARRALKVAVQLDHPTGADAVRQAMQGLPTASRRAARKLAERTSEEALVRKAWKAGSYTLARRNPRLGAQLAQRRSISCACFLHAFTEAHHALPHAEGLIAGKRMTHNEFLSALGNPEDIALTWTVAGKLPVDAFFAHVPQPTAHSMAALVKAKKIVPERWLAQGNMPAEEIGARLDNGEWTPFRCIRGGWVPDACIRTWLAEGKLELRTYVVASLEHWKPTQELPPTLVQFACSFPSFDSLVDTLGRLQQTAGNTPVFKQFARRLLAAHVQGVAAYARLAAPSGLPAPTRCVSCYDDLPAGAILFKPGACNHAAEFCRDCMEKAVDARTHCPYPRCETPLIPDDLLRFGRGAAGADLLAKAIIGANRASNAHWVPCTDPACFGGIAVPPGDSLEFACGGCNQVQVAHNFVVDLESSKDIVRNLIENLAPGGKTHECPACGTAQTHTGGCAIMNCGGCHANFHLLDGPARTEHASLPNRGQTYVPRAGLLVKAGVYEGLELGSTKHDAKVLLAKVRANAVAKGWLEGAEEEEKKEKAPVQGPRGWRQRLTCGA